MEVYYIVSKDYKFYLVVEFVGAEYMLWTEGIEIATPYFMTRPFISVERYVMFMNYIVALQPIYTESNIRHIDILRPVFCYYLTHFYDHIFTVCVT